MLRVGGSVLTRMSDGRVRGRPAQGGRPWRWPAAAAGAGERTLRIDAVQDTTEGRARKRPCAAHAASAAWARARAPRGAWLQSSGSSPGGEPSTCGRVRTRPRVSERAGFALASCPVASCPETRARAARGPRSAPRRGGRGAGGPRGGFWGRGRRGTRTASACASPAGRQPCKCAASSARARASAAADETVQKQRCTPKLDFERKTSPSDRKRFATLSVSVRPCNDSSLRILRQEQHARRNASEREGWAQTFAAGRRPRWSRRKCKQKEEEDDGKQFEIDQELVPHL